MTAKKGAVIDFQKDAMVPVLHRVAATRKETDDTFTLELEPSNGARLQPFLPGQFNMFYVHGVGEVPISISGDPSETKRYIHTTRQVGLVTGAMKKLKKGDTVGLRGPFGSHWPVTESHGRDVILIAGGIGLAPLRPALYQVMATREHFGRVVLLYGTRTPEDILFKRELQKWRAKFDLEVYVTVDRASHDWRGAVGVVPSLIAKAPFDPEETIAMICGPEIMMRYTVEALVRRGMDSDRIHISMERNMKCGIGLCGHCQYGPEFICKDGPVFRHDRVSHLIDRWEF